MNKTKYDDWLVKLVDFIDKLLIKAEDLAKLLSKFKVRDKINKRIEGYSKRIHAAETTPRGHWGIKYAFIRFELVDDYEKLLMEYAANLDLYFYNYENLDLSDRIFYIKGKSAAQRFMLMDDESAYRDTKKINKYIESGEPFGGMFYVTQVSRDEYNKAPDNKKLKVIKNGGV